ncbi:MAG TPA: hypothetical protein VK804_31345 [Bradyrhizobium sp.]|uniref:hypothetical protein n=1 Tax=Bradyrhizobium sp. TaxID=376 RepID=UPI002B8AF15F|nr:hypothetical protein [Bradyrhizobium sp.]HTB04991.1 hypothetical protein [Bradyrhizobium sp.]
MSGAKPIKIVAVAAIAISSLMAPAYPQGLGQKGHYDGPPVQKKTPIDEKAYKSALERIPEPTRKYDPWGVARPAEPAKTGKK